MNYLKKIICANSQFLPTKDRIMMLMYFLGNSIIAQEKLTLVTKVATQAFGHTKNDFVHSEYLL